MAALWGQPDQEGAFISGRAEQLWLVRNFCEDFLQNFTGIVLIAGEVQQKGEQRLRVPVVKAFEVGGHCSLDMTHTGGGFV